MSSENDIIDYINNFYGYGNFDSSIWFIGIEEGGGNSKSEFKKRIDSWFGYKTPLIDIKEHHINIGQSKYFVKGTLQNTWRKLIRIKLRIDGEKVIDNNLIRHTQQNKWGQLDSNNALIELFPLPSPSHNNWKYNEWTNVDFLESRELYSKHILESRIDFIKQKIQEHKPKIVIFYSKTHINIWNKIIDQDFESADIILIGSNCISIIQKEGVYFVLTPHPASVWVNDFWDKVGSKIHEVCNKN